MSLLRAQGVMKKFGGLQALAGVDFSVGEEEVIGLVGPNGAGKSTMFNVLTRFIAHDSGTITFNGTDISKLRPEQIVAQGMARTFQHIRIFQNLTVTENVIVGLRFNGRSRRDIVEEATALVDFVGLSRMADSLGERLSYGQQKLVSIARALATHPKLLMLDEPLSGLSHAVVAEMIEMIRRIRQQKKAVLIIDHNMEAIAQLSDRVVVMGAGRVVFDGTPTAMLQSETVISAYIGRPIERNGI